MDSYILIRIDFFLPSQRRDYLTILPFRNPLPSRTMEGAA